MNMSSTCTDDKIKWQYNNLFGTLVGVSVLSVMWLELESVSEISSPRWSSVYESQSVECAFTSPVIIELGMLV